ncbi:MAG: chemotaxis protein CheR [Rhodanobacter sp.]|nr:MAG: chemotaxis protein CheR [Rhodanobacter sp.]TAM10928.1 MAG: chemotaxis protein CheR [Rhodanobacter sp.]TAM37686.1 MAG: chemotaxis protein CheR [Rhodanobacter sp.]
MHASTAQRKDAGVSASPLAGVLLGDHEFAYLRDFVYQNLGIALSDQKRQLVQGRLARRLRQLHLPDYAAYCALLRADADSELGELASVISTNVTSFFREPHHYELLEKELLPQWLDCKRRDGDRLRIWSAGCSSGEEPYAIAMVLAEALETAGAKHLDAKILATDLSPQVLETARNGVYAADRLGGISAERRHRWLLRGSGANEGYVRVHPRLRELVTVQPLNLLHDWPMKGLFDAIFCRNVVIYFDTPTKKRLFSRYAALLPAGGYLFLGHSESMHGINDDFELVGRTAYRKRA